MRSTVRQVIGEAADVQSTPEMAQDEQDIMRAIAMIKQRFIDERVNGYLNPRTRQQVPPVSQEEAEARWNSYLPAVQKALGSDPAIQSRLGIEPKPTGRDSFGYAHPEAR